MTVDGGDHAIDLEAFTLGHIESPVDQNLNLEPLEEAVVLSLMIVPTFDSSTLETDPFTIESRRDLETARVVGDHGPGITAASTRPCHSLERRLAV